MSKLVAVAMCVSVLMVAGDVAAQGMLLDFAADKVIAKYQAATCAQLGQQKNEPKTEKEEAAIEFLRNDLQAREAFINKVAAPVAKKLFECGLIP